MKLRSSIAIVVLLSSIGCGRLRPVIDTGAKPDVGGSISGIVTADDGATPLGARKVTAINMETGARFEVSTSSTGGYTVQVPHAGKYKLEVELRPGESLAKDPVSTDIHFGDLDVGRDFVVTRSSH